MPNAHAGATDRRHVSQKPLLEQRTARFCSFPSSTRLCGTIRWVGRSDRYAHGKRHYIRLDAFKTWIFFTYGDGQNGRHCMKIEIVDNEAERGRTAPAISSRVELFGLLCRPCKVTKNQLSGRARTTSRQRKPCPREAFPPARFQQARSDWHKNKLVQRNGVMALTKHFVSVPILIPLIVVCHIDCTLFHVSSLHNCIRSIFCCRALAQPVLPFSGLFTHLRLRCITL